MTTGTLSWLYVNHQSYSGNVPSWANWMWPKGEDGAMFKLQFNYLLVGLHPAGGDDARCRHILCKENNVGSVYNHHFFECVCHMKIVLSLKVR